MVTYFCVINQFWKVFEASNISNILTLDSDQHNPSNYVGMSFIMVSTQICYYCSNELLGVDTLHAA
jgi:hypothetical protein